MNISAQKKAALEAAGYTVSKQGGVLKDGRSVAGYNENGGLWSGSSKVTSILKGKDAPAATKAAPKAAPKKAAPKVRHKADPKKAAAPTTKPKANPKKAGPSFEKTGRGKAPIKTDAKKSAGVIIPAVAAAVAAKPTVRAKPVGKPGNPNYKGGKGSNTGFQGKYETGVSRGEGRGPRKLGYAPNMRNLGKGGGGRPSMMDDMLNRRLQ